MCNEAETIPTASSPRSETGDEFGLGTARTLQSFADRVGVDFRTATVTSPNARNAGRPSADFNDSVALGLEEVLGLLQGNLKGP